MTNKVDNRQAAPWTEDWNVVNRPVEKIDSLGLATGVPAFTDDETFKDMLYGAILTSPHAHARIRRIDVSKAEALAGVHAVLFHGNVPRVPHTTAGQSYPEPSAYDTFMFDNKVRYVGDRVAAVAAETPERALEACRLIEVEYEELEPLLDPRRAMEPGAPVIHDEPDATVIIPMDYDPKRNLAAHVDFEIGSIEQGLAEADVHLEGEFETQYAQHCPIEPHITISYLDERGRVVIRTSTQVPFHVRRIVAACCQIPVGRIRVIKPRIGGGFGVKQEILLEDVCAMLTLRTGRPVKIEYSRSEEFVSSRTRHPSIIQLDLGLKRTGEMTAIKMDVLLNTGAYGSHALTVGSNCGAKVLPLYRSPNVAFNLNGVYTNLPVGGAYRGYGATQASFPMECLMDEAAEALGMDPIDLRLKNHITTGQTSDVFKALGEGRPGVEMIIGSCGLDECLKQGADAISWRERRGKPGDGPIRRGLGLAALMQGSSIPEIDMGAAFIKMNEDGSFNLLVGATDLGTGSDTVLAQIAAEVLTVDLDRIVVKSSDTDITPFDVGAYASSTTYLSGMAVKKAAARVRRQILEVAAKMKNKDPDDLSLKDGAVVGAGIEVPLWQVGTHSLYKEDQFQIAATASHVTHKSPPPFAAHFAEVAVDTETGHVQVVRYVAAVDCGTAINPQLAEGQTEGAVLNGISYALTEQYLFDSAGRMKNPHFRDYKIFSTVDLPSIETILVPTYEPTGPYGAKSVSEISINGPAPAIANAIYDAVGVRLRTIPFTPDKVLAAIEAQRKSHGT
ncbi:MAG: molybdopterin-dependent oxidoreductase [Deltaproteobacteria bacterium]|nr:molybdopterin-dependent oxidoreductase [Deltaproteobacteria bacterium]